MSRVSLVSDLTYVVPSLLTTGAGAYADPYDIQIDIDHLFNDYDFRGFNVTVQLAGGTDDATRKWYRGIRLSGRFVGQSGMGIPLKNMPGQPDFVIGRKGRFTIQGNPAFNTGAFFHPTAADGGAALSMSEGASLVIRHVGMDTSRGAQDCIDVFDGAVLDLADVVFGTAGIPAWCNHISAAFGAKIQISGPIYINGSAASFCNIGAASIYWNNNGDPGYPLLVKIAGVQMPKGFILADAGIAYPMAIQWVGSFVGPQAMVIRNGVVMTNGAGIPGSAPPIIQSGGQYL